MREHERIAGGVDAMQDAAHGRIAGDCERVDRAARRHRCGNPSHIPGFACVYSAQSFISPDPSGAAMKVCIFIDGQNFYRSLLRYDDSLR
ncbi:MAG TPA: hypothetical protein VEA38_06225, partial [Terriglobales bacterium]|nr:hypothetical protein [Terriglobales bacterium]